MTNPTTAFILKTAIKCFTPFAKQVLETYLFILTTFCVCLFERTIQGATWASGTLGQTLDLAPDLEHYVGLLEPQTLKIEGFTVKTLVGTTVKGLLKAASKDLKDTVAELSRVDLLGLVAEATRLGHKVTVSKKSNTSRLRQWVLAYWA